MSETNFYPKVSVVVPSHNRKDLLKETIDSILKQTFTDFELIVVSDGSSDGTNEMVKSLNDARIKLIVLSQSGQPATPRNVGIQQAQGEYIALCDDDDLWQPEKLKLQIELLDKNPMFGLCYTNGLVLKDGIVSKKWLNRRKIFKQHFRYLLYGNVIPNSSTLIRKSIFNKVGYINTDNYFRGIEDYEFWLRVSFYYPFVYIDKPLIIYRVHNSNITFSRAIETRRAIQVILHVSKLNCIKKIDLLPALLIQYSKYLIYNLMNK